jgi:exodeoxyribonuclease VII large subunit
VAVQGEGSVPSIQRALSQLEALPSQDKPDLVILARGGGSLEDLWGFNDEGLARQIAAFSIPIITAVGHETDTTLVDYVSDRRAPTPTAAAEIALPVRSDLIKNVSNLSLRLNNTVSALLDRAKILVHGLGQQLVHPRQAFEQLNIRLDDLVERQRTQVQHQLDRLTWHLSNLGRALRPPHLLLQDGRNQLAHLDHRLQKAWSQSVVGPRQERLKSFVHVLSSLAPQNTLKRGYAIVTKTESAEIISSRLKAEQTLGLSIQFHDGVVKTRVERD